MEYFLVTAPTVENKKNILSTVKAHWNFV